MQNRTPALANLTPAREACRAWLAQLTSEVAAIKARIAAADLERQRRCGKVDPSRFQEAKTTLRNQRREIDCAHGDAAVPARRIQG